VAAASAVLAKSSVRPIVDTGDLRVNRSTVLIRGSIRLDRVYSAVRGCTSSYGFSPACPAMAGQASIFSA